MSLKIRRNSCLRHATGIFFVLLSALASVNFNVCSIDFVMLLLNGVPLLIFVLIRDCCTHLAWMDFLMPQLCGPFFDFHINSGDAVLLLIRSCRCDGFHNTVHRLFGPYVTKLIWRTCQG